MTAPSTATSPLPVGVKLGSTRTVLAYPEGEGNEFVEELTCMTTYQDVLSGETKELYGDDAASEYPFESQFMIRNGLPVDNESISLASSFFSELLTANNIPTDSVVVFAIPGIKNKEGLRRLESVVTASSVGQTLLRGYPESLCGAIPAFDSESTAVEEDCIVINLGGTILEITGYHRGEPVMYWSDASITGNRVDRKIARGIEAETQGRVHIDPTIAREYKERFADLLDYEPFSDVVQQPGGGSHRFTVKHSVMEAVEGYVDEVVTAFINDFLGDFETSQPKVFERAISRPIVLTGGMACIPGLAETVAARLRATHPRDISVTQPPRPERAAAQGALEIATHLKKVSISG